VYDEAYETPYWTSERKSFVDAFARHAARRGIDVRTARILDVGTGTGNLLARLRDAGARKLVGADISEEMLAIARRKFPDVEFLVGPIEETRAPATFDAAVGFSVLHHLPDLGLFFDWLATTLRPGGVFAFSDGNAKSVLLHARRRWLVWGSVYPVHKPMRLLNRSRLARVPEMHEPRFYSEIHRALTAEELTGALPPTLEASTFSRGILAPTFNNALVDRPIDGAILRAARIIDRVLPFEGDALTIHGARR